MYGLVPEKTLRLIYEPFYLAISIVEFVTYEIIFFGNINKTYYFSHLQPFRFSLACFYRDTHYDLRFERRNRLTSIPERNIQVNCGDIQLNIVRYLCSQMELTKKGLHFIEFSDQFDLRGAQCRFTSFIAKTAIQSLISFPEPSTQPKSRFAPNAKKRNSSGRYPLLPLRARPKKTAIRTISPLMKAKWNRP